MDEGLELIAKRQTGRRLTAPVPLHQVAGDPPPVDRNEFFPVVAETGASAAIASDPTRAMDSPSDLALLQTQDTLTSLHKLAPSYRQLMPQRPESSLQPNRSPINPFTSGTQIMHWAFEKHAIMSEVVMWCLVWGLVIGVTALWHVPILSQLLF